MIPVYYFQLQNLFSTLTLAFLGGLGTWFKRLPTSWQLWSRSRSVLTIDCPVSPAWCAGYIERANWTRPHIMWDPRPVLLACLLSPHLHHGKPQLHQTLHRVGSSASKSSIRMFIITEKAPTRAFSWLKAATTAFTFKTLLTVSQREIGSMTQLS